MHQLSVLAVSPSNDGIASAQLEFSQAGTEVRYGRTIAEAAWFLSRHPGALVICEKTGGRAWDDALSFVLSSGWPSAVVSIANPSGDSISVEVSSQGPLQTTSELLGNPETLREISLAWQRCKTLCPEEASLNTPSSLPKVM
jgi:hypothetical protein